jgi:hypothetical protein
MPTYRVRLTWQAVTEVVVDADNVVDAQNRAKEKASGDKPKATEIVSVKVLSMTTSEK